MRRMRISFEGARITRGPRPWQCVRTQRPRCSTSPQKVREALAREAGPNMVWNIGVVQVAPGAANVVPATAEFVLEYRDPSDISLDRLTSSIRALVVSADGKNGVAARAEPMEGLRPTAMARNSSSASSRRRSPVGPAFARMSSGAGHDGMISGFAYSVGDDVRSQYRGPKS